MRLRSWIGLCLVVALAVAVAAPSAEAYQFFSETEGGNPSHWLFLPVALTVDNGPTDISGEIATATSTWNNVATARDPWGTATKAVDGGGQPVDFTGANFGTAWGNLTADGSNEVVFDETGSALRALGLAPASVNGIGQSHAVANAGNSVIDDMYLVVNGTRTNFDRQSTEIHELAHTLGIAHSTVGWSTGTDGSLAPILTSQSPTMHPFSVPGTDRRTLEADDVAALSELYPEPTFSTTTGTITGTVTRCGTNEPVLGANVRAINVANPAIQLTRVTGFDGETDGSYTIKGVPPGTYHVVVEPLSGDSDFLDRLSMFTPVDTGFQAEFINPSVEGDCGQDTDATASEDLPVGASGVKTADAKVEGASLALVIDVTGSMGPEIGAIKTALETMITALEAVPGSFPNTSIVTFDDVAQIRLTSRDPDRLRDVIAGLTTHSTADCPEGSNAAAMTAGRLLGSGGRAVLVTDAESRPNGPSRTAVDELYAEKNAHLSVLLSGSCPPGQGGAAAARTAGPVVTWSNTAPFSETWTPDEDRPVDQLGAEGDVRTFSEESLFSGGLFSFQPEVKGGTPDAVKRYSNTLANLGISSVLPAVATVNPTAVPQGTTLDVELTGSNTGFRAGSTVAVSGSGVAVDSIAVLSPTRMTVRLTAAPGAALGFRDVTVTTDLGDGSLETAHGIGPIQVVAPPSGPTVLSVTPSTIQAGATANVTISGGLTHFDSGNSAAALGDEVVVNSLTVNSPTSAVANVTASSGAAIGFRDVTVQTGGELATENVPGPLLVIAAPPPVARLTAASPNAGTRGSTVDVTLTGANTTFTSGQSLVSLSGTGVQLVSTAVNSPTSLVARLAIAANAPLGFRDLRVTTGAEHAVLSDGFEVRPVPGGGGPGDGVPPGTCTDSSRPTAKFRKGVKGVRAVRRKLHIRGSAADSGCVADIPVAGRVARVELAIARRVSSKKCRFLAANGRLGRRRGCSRPVFLRAKGTTTWTFDTKRRLPRGAYTLQVRARDAAGNLQARAVTRALRLR